MGQNNMEENIEQLKNVINDMQERIEMLERERNFWNVEWHKLASNFKEFARTYVNVDKESNDQSNMLYENRGK